MVKYLILSFMFVSCMGYKCDYSEVKEIGMCSNATSNSWNGREEGICVVTLKSGALTKTKNPTYVGERIAYNCSHRRKDDGND